MIRGLSLSYRSLSCIKFGCWLQPGYSLRVKGWNAGHLLFLTIQPLKVLSYLFLSISPTSAIDWFKKNHLHWYVVPPWGSNSSTALTGFRTSVFRFTVSFRNTLNRFSEAAAAAHIQRGAGPLSAQHIQRLPLLPLPSVNMKYWCPCCY